ncbi:MAG: site-2 protease family protein [Planctomycetota bacterium]
MIIPELMCLVDTFAAIDLSTVLSKFMSILSVVLGLGLVIFFHELGHFAVAKLCNVHVERFSIGMGPILWSRQRGETEYALSAFPFGGYVKMLGQDDMDPNQMTSSEIAENPRSYSAKTVLQRMAIISAGVIMNIATGFLFFVISYWYGVFEPAPVVGEVITGLPAWQHGIRSGDRITAINGDRIRSFEDVHAAVMLSSGDLVVEGTHLDGSTFQEILTPTKLSPGRATGMRMAGISQIASVKDIDRIADLGLPLRNASEKLAPGDRILSVRPVPVSKDSVTTAADGPLPAQVDVRYLSTLRQSWARYADYELIHTVERMAKAADGEQPGEKKTLEISVPTGQVKSIGLWMAMGPVRAVQKGSIAEKAGIAVGDRIVKVDDKEPGITIDPLELPVYFAKQAGKNVQVTVKRPTPDGDKVVELQVVPEDLPGWVDEPMFQTTPLAIPSLGIGYQVKPYIAKVLPGSEAESLSVFKPEMKITRVELVHPEPGKNADAFGSDSTPQQINLAEVQKGDPGKVEDINWAWAFAQIQRAPVRHVRLYYDDGKNPAGSEALTKLEYVPGWNLWFRGFNSGIWKVDLELQKGDSFVGAMGLGLQRTRKTTISIYGTLRSLLLGDISPDSLGGPLKIAQIGYEVAERSIVDLVLFLGFLSINLAIFNFLPIPILDGGHMVFLLWEGITRRKPSPRVINYAHLVGLLFIISLFAFVMYSDIRSL